MANSYKALTLALFLSLGTSAHAGYAQAKPPSGWSPSGFTGPAANNPSYYPGGVRTTASINVGGKAVTMPANLRFSANAPRFAGAVLFANPYIRGAAAIAGWLGVAGLVYDAASGLWKREGEDTENHLSSGLEYHSDYNGGSNYMAWFPTPGQACESGISNVASIAGWFSYEISSITETYCAVTVVTREGHNPIDTGFRIFSRPSSCPSGWYVTPAGCVQTPPAKTVNEEEFLDALTQHPMPAEVPRYIPAPLPVELPEMPPAFVPTGNPVPNPDYNPQADPSPENQPYKQPGVRIVPTPTPSSPWQVDLQPVNRASETPDPKPEPEIGQLPEPGTNPGSGNGPETGGPGTTPPGQTIASPGLCDKYPDILACQTIEEPEEEELPEKDISEKFQIIGGFYSSATCPAFPTIDMLPGLSWQPFCDQLARIRPLVLAFAWLSAVMIILKFGRK